VHANRRLAAIFQIHAGEGRVVVLLLLFSFCLGIPQVFVETAANTLFLTTFDARGLALIYLGFALTSPLVGLLYSWAEARISLPRLLAANLGLLLLSLLALQLALTTTASSAPIVVLAIWGEVVWVLTSLVFGALVGQLFNVRQSRRLVGLVGSGEVVAGILGGFLIPLLVRRMGTASLLLVAALGAGLALALLPALWRAGRSGAWGSHEGSAEPAAKVPARLLKSGYIRLIFAFAALSLLGYFFLDTMFYIEVEARYPDEEQLASFLGVFYGLVGLLTLAGRSLLIARVLERFGMLGGLLAVPLAVVGGTLAIVVAGLAAAGTALIFWLVVLTKLLNEVLKDAIDQPVSLILYQPLRAEQRVSAQTAVESTVEPLASGIAGILLLVLGVFAGLSNLGLTIALLGMLAIWMLVGLNLERAYTAALLNALARRWLGGVALTFHDGSSRAILRQALRSPHADEVIYALSLIEQSEPAVLPELLPSLLTHPAPGVRVEALQRVEQRRLLETLPAVSALLEDQNLAVRGRALRTLAVLEGQEGFARLAPYLDDETPQLRLGLLAGLLRGRPGPGMRAAEQQLTALASSPAADQRAQAAQLLGEVADSAFNPWLLPLLHDKNPQVREAALAAAGKIGGALWPHVVAALATPEVYATAATALARGGAAALPALAEVLANSGYPRTAALRATRVCGRIGQPALGLLLKHCAHADPAVRHQVLLALSRHEAHIAAPQAEQIRVQIRAEVADITALLAALDDLGAERPLLPLRDALAERILRARDRVLLLLTLIADRQSILRARDGLALARGEQRAYAVEALDLLLDSALKPLVLPLCDELSSHQQLQRLGALFPQPRLGPERRLRQLAAESGRPRDWIAVCAQYALERLELVQQGDSSVIALLERVLLLKTVSIFAETPDSVLAEIAAILEETPVAANTQLFAKGEPGRCMYIVAEGRLRVHDGDHTLNLLYARDVFGEMAVLGTGLRVASVTAVDDCLLLRLDQEPLYELMADRVEVARGIIQVLSGRLSDRVHDLREVQARVQGVQPLEGAAPA
jgi:ATP:ADP antiporter, AAA family